MPVYANADHDVVHALGPCACICIYIWPCRAHEFLWDVHATRGLRRLCPCTCEVHVRVPSRGLRRSPVIAPTADGDDIIGERNPLSLTRNNPSALAWLMISRYLDLEFSPIRATFLLSSTDTGRGHHKELAKARRIS